MGDESKKEHHRSAKRPGPSGEPWDALVELLISRQYKLVAEILGEVQKKSEEEGDLTRARLLGVVRELCLTAGQNVLDGEVHLKKYQESRDLDQKLQGQLWSTLELLGQEESTEIQGKTSGSLSPDRPLFDPPGLENKENQGLWKRVKSKLQQWSETQSLQQEAVEIPKSASDPPLLPESNFLEISAELPVPTDSPEKELSEGESIRPSVKHADPVTEQAEPESEERRRNLPFFNVYCLGRFHVYQDEIQIEDWSSSKGNAIFKYLVTHREQPIAKEVLMELFWPEADPESARNSLNVAIYSLRQCLRRGRPNFSHILYQGDSYLLNPKLQIWVDAEEFIERFSTAQKLEENGEMNNAIRNYHAAEALYQGAFLEEDRYEDWILPIRQSLQDTYLRLLDRLGDYYIRQENYDACSFICRKALAIDPCLEEAHSRLMHCYSGQGQRYLALRQYHLCEEILAQELDTGPSQSTRELYNKIRKD